MSFTIKRYHRRAKTVLWLHRSRKVSSKLYRNSSGTSQRKSILAHPHSTNSLPQESRKTMKFCLLPRIRGGESLFQICSSRPSIFYSFKERSIRSPRFFQVCPLAEMVIPTRIFVLSVWKTRSAFLI